MQLLTVSPYITTSFHRFLRELSDVVIAFMCYLVGSTRAHGKYWISRILPSSYVEYISGLLVMEITTTQRDKLLLHWLVDCRYLGKQVAVHDTMALSKQPKVSKPDLQERGGISCYYRKNPSIRWHFRPPFYSQDTAAITSYRISQNKRYLYTCLLACGGDILGTYSKYTFHQLTYLNQASRDVPIRGTLLSA